MSREIAPPDVVALADARSAARRARDWDTADALRARIEAAGWRVIDAASLYTLERAVPEDVVEDGVTWHGGSLAVPSRLDDEPVGVASIVVVAEEDEDALASALGSLAAHAPDGTQVVVVANGPSERLAATIRALDAADPGAPGVMTEAVWLRRRLGVAAARNAGIRRATGRVVVLVDPAAVTAEGDVVSPLVAALDDPEVAIAGPFGLVTADLRAFEPAAPGDREVDAIEGSLVAFRREDYAERGPLDEHFAGGPWLDAWWSLVLREPSEAAIEGWEASGGGPLPAPRRARQVEAHGLRRRPVEPPAADRAERKAFYRFLKRFASRHDLVRAVAADEGRGEA